jgi:Tfp pilus assembly protein PilN
MSTLDNAPEVAVELPPAPPRPVPAEAGPGPRRPQPLNLARRPFLNSRPVVRFSLLLWVLGLLLLLANLSLFRSYLSSSVDKRAQLAQGEEEIQRQQQQVQQLQSRLDGLDLERQNEQIDFLNEKIEQRTFSWSLLLDRLVEVLPNDIRLARLTPLTERQEEREAQSARQIRRRSAAGQVPLTISGESRDDEALLRFVDNLFAHPAFTDPNLLREERQENNLVRFELTVQYIPGGPPKSLAIGGAPRVEEAQPGNVSTESVGPGPSGTDPSGGQP